MRVRLPRVAARVAVRLSSSVPNLSVPVSRLGRCATNLRTAPRSAYLASWKRTELRPHPGPNQRGPRSGNQRPPGRKAARQRHRRPQRQRSAEGARRRPPSDRSPRRPQGLAHNGGLSALPSPLTTSPSNAASPQIASSTTGLLLNEASRSSYSRGAALVGRWAEQVA